MSETTEEIRWPDIGDVYIKETDRWIFEYRVTGFNGLGCPWLILDLKWKDGKICRQQPMSLNREETLQLLKTTKLK